MIEVNPAVGNYPEGKTIRVEDEYIVCSPSGSIHIKGGWCDVENVALLECYKHKIQHIIIISGYSQSVKFCEIYRV